MSATEAISPAIARTKLILFKPFRLGRTWKLAATGYLSGSASTFLPLPLVYLAFIPIVWHDHPAGSGAAIICSAVAVMMGIYIFIFYLCSRLRFAFFDIVLNRGEFVAPAWRKYGSQSRKWTLFKIALGTFLFVLLAIPLIPLIRHFFVVFDKTQPFNGQDPSPAFAAALFTIYGTLFLVYIVIGLFALANSLLSDFVVPSLALEDTSLAEAFRRAGRLVRNEPGAVFVYALMKAVVFLVGGMASAIFFYIFLFVVVLVASILGFVGYFILHLLHVPREVMVGLAIAVGFLLYISTIFYGTFFASGTLYTLTESYALYFLGGRYPLLGDLLDRSTPPSEPMTPPPNYLAYATPPNESL